MDTFDARFENLTYLSVLNEFYGDRHQNSVCLLVDRSKFDLSNNDRKSTP